VSNWATCVQSKYPLGVEKEIPYGGRHPPEGRVEFGSAPATTSIVVEKLVVDAPSAYNVILVRRTWNDIEARSDPVLTCL
jgi:hypothetical protein